MQDTLEEGRRRGRQARGGPVAVDGGGFEEGVGRVDLEGRGEEVLALGDLALVDLLVHILVWRSALDIQ
jgi:hypothetical protein